MTINQIVYQYIKSNQPTGLSGFFYNENDKGVKAPYGTIFLIEDPKEKPLLCPSDQGEARFQVDVFAKTPLTGFELRQELQDLIDSMAKHVTDGFTIWKTRTLNVNDRADSVTALFQYSFEALISWEK